MDDTKRVYGTAIDLKETDIKGFFNKRAQDYTKSKRTRNTTVLLGDNDAVYADHWDQFEKEKILPILDVKKTEAVLDIGCGVGRWAESLVPLCGTYVGTDLSEEMINVATDNYSSFTNATFVNQPFQKIFDDSLISGNHYDVVIITGVSMYLNDDDLRVCYERLGGLLHSGSRLYIEESVGISQRLTLNNIWSDSLQDNYCAVYRTVEEYKELLKPLISCSEILQDGSFDEFNKEELSETGHWYMVLRQKA